MLKLHLQENEKTGQAQLFLENVNETSGKAVSLTTIEQNVVVLSLTDLVRILDELDSKSDELNSVLERKLGVGYELKLKGKKKASADTEE